MTRDESPSGGAVAVPDRSGGRYTVVYDGDCTICGRLVSVLRAWDRTGRLEIITSRSPEVAARFPWISAGALAESIQVIGPGGTTWQGAVALERLLDVLPGGRLIVWIFAVPFVRPLAEVFYRWFARNRYHMGCHGDALCRDDPDRL